MSVVLDLIDGLQRKWRQRKCYRYKEDILGQTPTKQLSLTGTQRVTDSPGSTWINSPPSNPQADLPVADSVGQEACFGFTSYCLGSSWLSKMLSKIGQAFRERDMGPSSEWPTSMTAESPLRGSCPVLTGISLAPLGVSFPIWKREGCPKQPPGIGTQGLMPLEHTGLPTTKEGRGAVLSPARSCSPPHPHTAPPSPGRPSDTRPWDKEENSEEGLWSTPAPRSASSQTLCRVRTWNTISMSDKELTEVFVLG